MYKFYLSALIIIGNINLFAQHTFSICAVDPKTGEVGSAGASCIANSIIISDVHPGVGVVHTQSYYVPGNQNYAQDLMNAGVPAAAIIDSVVANDIFDDATIRQYGAVDFTDGGSSASFTGDACLDWKGHLNGSTYAIQGNILLGPEILDGMEEGFLNTDGNLACRLMAALQGAKVPGADTRCLDWGISSESAFIRVAQPTDATDDLWLDLEVKDVNGALNLGSGIDPIDSLQAIFDAIGGCDFTGMNEIEQHIAPTIYPQPTFDIVIFSLDGSYENLTIYNLSGSEIFTTVVSREKNIVIDSRNWIAGIYLYSLTDLSGEIVNGKLIIE